ncbi:MAG: 16S rRNA (cytidine(1402)-2'-O)-methyltransferase [Dehalococcoidia bacterium]|nr:16S rRNA (cytidine(1402)-2'-O)-methyltransferase [Dehalococcoidia bacterium]
MSNLYIVGTPIGNLEDITIRALKTLENVDFIFSEDTRVSKKLLSKFEISAKIFSIYTHNKKLNLKKFEELISHNDLAFITDAGSPGVSDPAGEFVKFARSKNHDVIPIPGVSAVTSAFSVSGFESIGFSFLGFLPKSNTQKSNYISKYFETNNPLIIFESPKRIISTLNFLKEEFQIKNIFVAKEMTKIYETIFSGSIDSAIKLFDNEKGEFVVIFQKENKEISKSLILKYDKILINGYEKGIKGKKLLDLLSELTDINKGFFYERWLEIKNKNE